MFEFFPGREASSEVSIAAHLQPAGLRGISANMKLKVAEGNRFSDWMARLAGACVEEHMIVLVENPALSYLWWMPERVAMLAELSMGFFYNRLLQKKHEVAKANPFPHECRHSKSTMFMHLQWRAYPAQRIQPNTRHQLDTGCRTLPSTTVSVFSSCSDGIS